MSGLRKSDFDALNDRLDISYLRNEQLQKDVCAMSSKLAAQEQEIKLGKMLYTNLLLILKNLTSKGPAQ